MSGVRPGHIRRIAHGVCQPSRKCVTRTNVLVIDEEGKCVEDAENVRSSNVFGIQGFFLDESTCLPCEEACIVP